MTISGKQLRDAIISGANNIYNHKSKVDELNVFPVPDGDTGTNMSMTIGNALLELKQTSDDITAGAVAKSAASAMLRGARGNSGVILSLLFRGLSKGLSGKTSATAQDIARSLSLGVEAAYKSVMKPTEGTILTVARESSEAINRYAAERDDLDGMMELLLNTARTSLERTPDLLPALKKAGVVDAGGMGFYLIMEGMKLSLCDGKDVKPESEGKKNTPVVDAGEGSEEQKIKYTYCAEFLVHKKTSAKDPSLLRAFLESIGESVALAEDDGIIKAHVYTDHPGKALEEALMFGQLVSVKIENMREQHKDKERNEEIARLKKVATASPENQYGFVSVVSGAGLEALFTDLGVNSIVRGGQTSNPSTEDILAAILATPAKNVFVLPNNKNIIMAAEQAGKLTKDRRVVVLQSRTIPQGLSAMMSFDESRTVSENSVAMTEALDSVGTGSVTFAVRDSEFEDRKIKQGDILAMENGKLAVVERDVTKALIKITKKLLKGDSSYVTVIYGADVSDEDAESAAEALRAKLGGDIEVALVNGGMPVYYYFISVE